MASMQGNNILGEKKKEAKARSASRISGFDERGTGPAGGLGSRQEAEIRTKTSGGPPAECGRKEREKKNGWA